MISTGTRSKSILAAFTLLLAVGSIGYAVRSFAEEAAKPSASPSPAPTATTPPPSPLAKPADTPAPAPPAGENKTPEAKPATDPPPEAKPEAKPEEAKPAEAKPELKPAEAKPAEAKPEAKPAEAKPAEAKPEAPAAQAKADAADASGAKPGSEAAQAKPGATRAEPRLKFNFRFQQWADVLGWLAQEADLSLVLDVPPPGTFNYTDTREYTPVEAIDLVNGVLLTKGYTLIRRNRMLLVVNVKDGIPEGLVPQVKLTELEGRGKFELVTVQFPLGRKPAATVATEITPLLGPHGKVVPLPATSQVLVTDTAGVMQAIAAVIQSIPEPKDPPPKPPAKPEPSPVLATYPVKPADPKSLLKVVETMVPGAKVVLDEKSEQLHVSALESDQAKIKTIIDQVKAGNPPDQEPRLEVYAPEEPLEAKTVKSLQAMLPEAQLTFDESSGKLVAFATPAAHETIKSIFAKLESGLSPSKTPQLEVYPLTRVDPAAALATLQKLLPKAKLEIDTRTKSLIASATPTDQQAIKRMLDQLQAEGADSRTPQLNFYSLKQPPPASLLTVLKNAVPNATVTLEADGKHLSVLATADDQAVVKSIVEQTEKSAPPEEKNQLVIYPVTPAQRTRFQSVVSNVTAELPGIKVITDAEPGELAIWAKPSQHETLRAILDQLKRDVAPEEKHQLVAHSIHSADPASVLATLKTMYPNTQIVLDAKTNRLLVWTRPEEQASIKASLEQIETKAPAETQPRFEVYPVRGGGGAGLVASLATLVPNAKLTVDPKTGGLLAWATPAEHDLLKGAIGKLGHGGALENTPQMEVYRLTKADPTTTLALLKSLLPEAQLSLDAPTGKLVALAVPADQQTIRSLLDQLQSEKPEEDGRQLVAYQIRAADPTSVLTVLNTLFPTTKITLDKKARRISVFAEPAQQQTIKAAIDQMDTGVPIDTEEKVIVYPLSETDPTTAATILQQMVPDVKVQADLKSNKIVAWGSAADQQRVKQIIEQMQTGPDAAHKPRLVVYPTGDREATTVVTMLTKLVPQAQLVPDTKAHSIVALATPQDHGTILAAMEKMSKQAPGEDLAVYHLKTMPAASAVAALALAVPQALCTPGGDPFQVIAWARPEHHQKIRELIAKMEQKGPPDNAPTMATYSLGSVPAANVLSFLTTAFPQTKFTYGSDTNQIVAYARPSDHEAIRTVVEQLAKKEPPESAPTTATYSLGTVPAATAITFLATTFPQAKVTYGADPHQVLVYARPADHEAIKKAIDQMTQQEPPETAPRAVVYSLGSATSLTAMSFLSTTFPQAKFTYGSDYNHLVAYARPADHDAIKKAIDEIAKKEPAETAPTMEVYPLGSMLASGAVTFLTTAFPRATFSVGAGPHQLVVRARPDEHAEIKAAVDQLLKKEPPENAPKAVAYTLKSVSAYSALRLLTPNFPDAQFSAGRNPKQLMVFARAADQEAIKAAIEEMSQKEPPETASRVVTYTLNGSGAASAMKVLAEALPDAQFSVGGDPSQLVAFAGPADHEVIKAAVEQMEATAVTPASQVYRLQRADPKAALTVLQAMLPKATVAVDTTSRSIVASASPEDHKKIKATLDEMDRSDAGGQAPTVQVYRVASGDPTSVFVVLRTLFYQRPEVSISLDRQSDAIVAVASPAEHETIRELLDKVEKGALTDSSVRLELHSLKNIDSLAAMEVLEKLLQKQGVHAELSVDSRSNQLVSIARPEQQALIRDALEQLRAEERDLEIFQLDALEPATAQLAIGKLFSDDRKDAPEVESDQATQQLFVRASREQLEKIRDLLQRMGETGLTSLGSSSNERMRVIPLQGDSRATIEEIRRIWPKLRTNEVRVVTPSAVAPMLRRFREPSAPATPATVPAKPTDKAPLPQPGRAATPSDRTLPAVSATQGSANLPTLPTSTESSRGTAGAESPTTASKLPANNAESANKDAGAGGTSPKAVSDQSPPLPPKTSQPEASAAGPGSVETPKVPVTQPAPSAQEAQSAAAQPAAPDAKGQVDPTDQAPPIYLIPGDGSITILCDDPEALRQLESLLRTMSPQRTASAGRDVGIYPVRHTSATAVAATLRQLFRGDMGGQYGSYRRGSDRVMIVADARLNTILVQGSRQERQKVEELLEVLDTAEAPTTAAMNRPKMIPIKYTKAERIEQVIHDVFRSQLSGSGEEGGGRSGMLSAQVSVDEATNSLIVSAPPPLIDQITELAQTLDQAAETDSTRTLEMIRLKKTNVAHLQESLDTFLRDSGSRSRRSYRRSRD